MMRNSRFRTSAVLTGIVAVALGGCAVALGGCAVVHAPAKGTNSPAANPARAIAASARTPKQRAEADIAATLKGFAPPPGARQVSSSPASTLNEQPSPPLPDYVTGGEWWLAPGNPRQVLAWEAKHLPSQFGSAGGGEDGKATWVDNFILPDVPGVLTERRFSVATTAVGHGQTGIEVIARAQWIPARPASEVIPSAARVVTLTLTNTSNTTGQEPKPVTITDRAKVRRIAALLDGLTVTPPDAYSCPAERGGDLTLAFKAGVDAPALAIVTADLSGCAFITLTIGGKQQPGLGPGNGGLTLASQAVKIADLNWKIPG
jgi:hypothetical protein